MNRPLTYLSWPVARPACLAASVAVLQLLSTPAQAQFLAINSLRQSMPASASREVKSVPLKSLLKQWESEYHATIFYESNVVDNKRVVAQPSDGSLVDKLSAVLPQVSLQFKELRNNYFVVTSAPAIAGFAAPTSSAVAPQDVPVSGRVTDLKGAGLPGVTVLVKGTTNGTSTGADGSFSLSAPENSTLVFSSVGFKTQELAVTGTTSTIAIRLSDDQQALNEVVVVGYGTQNRQEVTTSVASVGGQALARQPVAGFDQALQGQAAGVQVTAPTGAPGAGINVRVRGNASLSLNGSPLYVVDGVPILPGYNQEVTTGNQRLNPLNTINPNDIESIDVLKDGAAAAIYGVRAANGVVVITTKHGKVGQAQVGLNVYYGRQYLRKKLNVLNAQQFAQEFNDIQTGAGLAPGFADPNNPSPTNTNTDWQDAVYRPGNQQNYQLSVSGGTEKTRYYISGGYFNQQGISLNSGFNRYNFKINLTEELSSRFRMGTNLNLSRTHNNGSVRSELALGNSGTVLGALSQIPTVPIYGPTGAYGVNPFNQSDNPVGDLLESSNLANVYQVVGNLYGEFDILKNLRARTSVGIDFTSQNENQYISTNYPGTSNADASVRGRAQVGNTLTPIWLWENTLTYNPNLGDQHHLTLLAGQSMQASDRVTSGATTQGFPNNGTPYLSGGSSVVGIPYSYEEQWSLVSYFARATYDYEGRYLAQVSMRADGTSRFSTQNRFGYFPAVSLGWNVAKESFFPQGTPISTAKVRASFGANGNQEIFPYQRFTRYSTGINYQGSGGAIAGGITQTDIGNDKLKWETTQQYNVGLDLGAFNNRLTFTFDAYIKHTKDLLLQVPIPLSTGAGGNPSTVLQNIGSVENRGLEFGLVTTNVESKDNSFGWTTSFNISANRNKILDLGQQVGSDGTSTARTIPGTGYSISQVGQSLGAFYGYVTQGIVQSNAEGQSLPTQNGNRLSAGDQRFADLNGDGVIDPKDQTVIGNPNPKFFGGVTNNFSYKGLELSVFFQGSLGNQIYNQNRQILESQSDPLNQLTTVLNHWTPTNTNTDIPRPVRNDPNGNNRFSNRWLEDGSYVRLKNLTLAYNVPTTFSGKAAIKSLRVYLTTQNLITWTHYSGYDPEVSADPFSSTSFGRDYGVYPQARTYTLGLNANF
jgi:TonB-linked SusC/RagA family outer membrane protein